MDIDSDFEVGKGQKVFKYLYDKYGADHCVNVITFGRMQTKSAIKDVSKALEIPFNEVNDFTHILPSGAAANDLTIDGILNDEQYNKHPFIKKYYEVFKHAKILEGSPRHVSQHPAGIAIAPTKASDYLPVYRGSSISFDNGEKLLCNVGQFEKDALENNAGLVKLDILKLNTVNQLQEQLKEVNKLHGTNCTLDDIPLDDEKTWNAFSTFQTKGVFQFGEITSKNVLLNVKPHNMEELAACNALIRPGTDGLEDYVKGKNNPNLIKKLDDRLDKWLAPTYGTKNLVPKHGNCWKIA